MKLILLYIRTLSRFKVYNGNQYYRTGTELGLCHYYIPLREAGK